MKKVLKKVVSGLLIAVMSAVGFTGCGESETSDGTAVLTWYYPGSVQKDEAIVEARINELIEPKIGAKIDLCPLDAGSYDEKLNMMMSSNEPFDICFSGYVNQYQRGVDLGGFLKLDEYLEKTPELKKSLPDYAWEAVQTPYGIYAVPNLQIYASWQGIYILKEYADKYNLDVESVKSITDLTDFIKTISEKEPNLYAYNPSSRETLPWDGGKYNQVISGISPIVFKVDDVNCKLVKFYETEEYKNGIKALREWYEKGYIRADIASAGGESGGSKKDAVWISAYKPGAEQEYFKNNGDEVIVIPIGEPIINRSMATQTLNAIGRNSKNPEKAIKFLELINTDQEVYRTLIHGIEGTHYEKVDDMTIRVLNKESFNYHTSGWKYGNQFNAYVLEGESPDKWEVTKELNEMSVTSPLLGFSPDTSLITNELANIQAAIDEFSGLGNGSVSLQQLDKYIAKLESAGIDDVIKELQKQIDEYLKK